MFHSLDRFRTLAVAAFAATALLASACSDSPAIAGPTAAAKASAGAQVVPITGTMNGYSYPLGNGAAVGCPAGFNLTGMDLTGQVSGLGNTSWASEHCNAGFVSTSVVATMTGASGSELYEDAVFLSYESGGTGTSTTVVSTSPRLVVDGVTAATITGGTGRFTGASGSASITCERTTPIAGDPVLPVHVPAYANIYACAITGMIATSGSSN